MKEYRHEDYFPPGARDIVSGPEIEPRWHVLLTPCQKMRACREFLRAKGVFAFYPSEERVRHFRGRKITREVAMVTGQVYALFKQKAHWDVMQARRLITGVYAIDGRPVIIPSESIKHLQGLTVEAARLREARAEFLRINVGDTAKLTVGPFTGYTVEISSIRGGLAWFDSLAGIKGSAEMAHLEKVTGTP